MYAHQGILDQFPEPMRNNDVTKCQYHRKVQKGQVLSAGLYAVVFKWSHKSAETLVMLYYSILCDMKVFGVL